ncbi:MAG: DUF4236 domain-containing protein [Clostridiaceae bacterium]|nr:DUF4236 domain-containing protein [Clostridiaceae bacterium]
MGLRVRKSIQICKGVRLNLGSTGASFSFGTKGLRHTIHTSGRRTTSIGIPGTGISYVKTHGSKGRKSAGQNVRVLNQPVIPGTEQKKVDEYNELIETIKGIHKNCDESIDWQYIKEQKEPVWEGGIGPKQAKAIEELKNYKPGFFEKLKSGNKKRELEKAVEIAAKEDAEDLENLKTLHILAERVLNGDIDAYLNVIYEMNPLDDLVEFGSDFEFGTDNPDVIEVEFSVKTADVVPTYSLRLTKTGKLSRKELTKTAYFGLVQDFVSSCTIRIARDIIALLPVKNVVVHAVEKRLNTQTGRMEDTVILSVVFDRDLLNQLNFDLIDPSDALKNFWHNMKFQKTAGFMPVEKIENY